MASSSCFSSKSAGNLTVPSTITQGSWTPYALASFDMEDFILTSTDFLNREVTRPTFSIKDAYVHAHELKGRKTSTLSFLLIAKHLLPRIQP